MAQKVSRALGTLTAAAGAFIAVGDELDDTSKKFSISAEQLQIQRNLYAKNTDDAKNYDKALSSLNSVMASIAKGRGAAYLETLNRLGVSATDAAGKTKSAAEVYGDNDRARTRGGQTERASLASILFGDNGLNVAVVAGLTREEIAAYNEELARHGIISSGAAAQAGAMSDQFDNVKQQFAAASAELMSALLPVILKLIEIARHYYTDTQYNSGMVYEHESRNASICIFLIDAYHFITENNQHHNSDSRRS